MTHPVRFEVEATDGTARAGVAHTARGGYRTPCFMPVGTRGAVKLLSAADLDDLGVADRARQHLPPHAAARRRDGGGARGPRPVHGLGRPDLDRLRRLPGLLPRARWSTTTASRSAPPTTARPTASRPETAVATQELLGRRHPDGARRLPGAARARARSSAWRSSAPRRGPSGRGWPTAAAIRPCSASSRAARMRPCGPRARSARSSSTSTATASGGCRWARRVTRCCPPWPPPWPTFPTTARGTSWGSATRRPWSRPWPSVSTSSTA